MLQTDVQLSYPCDLTDLQWEIIKTCIPDASTRGRPRQNCLRSILNAIFYINRTGCAWRYLPKDFPNWQTVYDYYNRWRKKGIIEKIHYFLVYEVRKSQGKKEQPYQIIIDSQACKAWHGRERGYDGFKKIRGRKRNIVVDNLGLIHGLRVDSAGLKDHKSVIEIFFENPNSIRKKFERTKELYADGGYKYDLPWLLEGDGWLKEHLLGLIITEDSQGIMKNTQNQVRV